MTKIDKNLINFDTLVSTHNIQPNNDKKDNTKISLKFVLFLALLSFFLVSAIINKEPSKFNQTIENSNTQIINGDNIIDYSNIEAYNSEVLVHNIKISLSLNTEAKKYSFTNNEQNSVHIIIPISKNTSPETIWIIQQHFQQQMFLIKNINNQSEIIPFIKKSSLIIQQKINNNGY